MTKLVLAWAALRPSPGVSACLAVVLSRIERALTAARGPSPKCGAITDQCGDVVACGGCDGANTCQGWLCTPKTCADVAPGLCGADDGCGGSLRCAPCPDGSQCTVSGACCTPKSCTDLGGACGGDDGCGGFISCATCPAGQVCGAPTYTCTAPPACVPVNPCSVLCGIQPDGCGSFVDCGNGAQCGSGSGPAPMLH